MTSKLYYLNNNRNKHYLLHDFEKQVIYSDDLIWFVGLSHWVRAEEVEELKIYLNQRPPISNTKIILVRSSLISLAIYFIFSLLIAYVAGFGEKEKFNSFIHEIEKAHNKNQIEKNKVIQARQEKIDDDKIINDRILSHLEYLLALKEEQIKSNLNKWKEVQISDYSNDILLSNYKIKHDNLSLEYDKLHNRIIEQKMRIENQTNDNSISLVEYDIPYNELNI